MRAWVVTGDPRPAVRLRLVDRSPPKPAAGEVRVQVSVCGVCRTDLHLAVGDLPAKRAEVTPGHEAVGRVIEVGAGVSELQPGDRVGVAWLRSTCGQCEWCRHGAENLCPRSTYTGWDADGGFADELTVPAAFAYRLTEDFDDEELAPLLCSGIIGYRALRRAAVPPGGRLGIYGFGSSAHLTAQIALAQGLEVHVLTRGEAARRLALELGVSSARGAADEPPVALDGAVLFAPVGYLVPVALKALAPGGTLAVAGIHLSDVPMLDYQEHLFQERTLTSVTANTRADGEQLLRMAARVGVRARITTYDVSDAALALNDLEGGRLTGSAVLRMK